MEGRGWSCGGPPIKTLGTESPRWATFHTRHYNSLLGEFSTSYVTPWERTLGAGAWYPRTSLHTIPCADLFLHPLTVINHGHELSPQVLLAISEPGVFSENPKLRVQKTHLLEHRLLGSELTPVLSAHTFQCSLETPL